MSFLNLKILLPPRKLWKLFTKKVIKLHKPNTSKPIKKFKYKSHKKTSKKIGWPSYLSIQPKKFKNTLIYNQNRVNKRPPPVFVDQLFIEPSVAVQAETSKEKAFSSNKYGNSKTNGEFDPMDRLTETTSIDEADDMWESLVLGSPQMHGINERADEFIARFRAQMHNQEIVARRL